MEVAIKITCWVLLVFGTVHTSVLPVEKCTLTDKACMLPAVQKMTPIFMEGMSEFGVEVLDPMAMYDTKFDLSGLKFTLTDSTLKGMKNVVVSDVEWNVKKNVFSITFKGDLLLKGHYTAAGHVLILPITGDGNAKMKMKNVHIKLFIHFNMNNGHLKPKKYNFDFEIKDNAHFHLTNLFNGNKELSEAMLTFLNENWRQIAAEFGRPVVESAAKKIYHNIATFFEKIPMTDIANI